MTNAKLTRRALLSSVLALVLCFTMLLGTTFAWFTDEAVSSGNKIIAGNLDVKLWLYEADGNRTEITKDSTPIFGANSLIAQNSNADTLWEPGKTQVAYLAIENAGNLDLKYQVVLEAKNEVNKLCDVMQYTITPDAKATDNTVSGWDASAAKTVSVGTQIVSDNGAGGTDLVLGKGETHYFALSIHMDENAGNAYKNGEVEFDLTVFATQLNSEFDGFGTSDYDKNAPLVAIVKKTVEAGATTTTTVNGEEKTVIAANNTVEIHNGANADASITEATDATVAVTLPAGVVLEDGATELQLVTKEADAHENVTLTAGNVTVAYEIKVEGVVEATDEPIVVTLKEALPKNLTNVKVYHNGVEMGANEFSYDINTGDVTLYVKHFSNFTFSGEEAVETTVLVATEEELRLALHDAPTDGNRVMIRLTQDITLMKKFNGSADNASGSTINGYVASTDGKVARLVVKANQRVTLDLNGYTLRRDAAATHGDWSNVCTDLIGNFGILTIKDSSAKKTGLLLSNAYGWCQGSALYNYDGGVMTVMDVTVDGNSNKGAGQYVVVNDGTIVIDGATICDTATVAALVVNRGDMTVKGGAVLEQAQIIVLKVENGTVVIDGATLKSDSYALRADKGTVEIQQAEFGSVTDGKTPIVAKINGTVTIADGVNAEVVQK